MADNSPTSYVDTLGKAWAYTIPPLDIIVLKVETVTNNVAKLIRKHISRLYKLLNMLLYPMMNNKTSCSQKVIAWK